MVIGAGSQRASCFTDVQFDRVQAITAVGNVGGANILPGRQEVLDPDGKERTQGYLEGSGGISM